MLKYFIFLLLCAFALSLQAQITLDGTLGPHRALPGPDYQIGAELGQQHGANLFHSFNEFNLSEQESATFSGPTTVENIISRVTGGGVSHLDGLLRSTIPEADFYFINPAGIHMGPHASLDISGSFHASSADVLRFEDGGNFNARHPEASILSVAPISAFGFLTDSPSSITVENSQLSVSEQQSFSLIGGDITMNQAQLQAPFGRLNLGSVAGEGEIALEPNALTLTGSRGNISIRDSMINLSGEGGGGIYVQGGQVVMAGSKIETHTLGSEGGRNIIIRADQVTLEGGELSSIIFESGQGNNIDNVADTLLVTEASQINTSFRGDAGNIEINARQIKLEAGAQISGGSIGMGKASHILLTTDRLLIKGSFIEATTSLGGASGGDIEIEARQMILKAGGYVAVSTLGEGKGGNLTLNIADTLLITEGSEINASGLSPNATGDGGDIKINARQVTLETGGIISSDTLGKGKGGNITLTDVDTLLITGESSSVSAEAFATGAGGNIQINAQQVKLEAGGKILASTSGEGKAGRLALTVADTLLITGKNSDGLPSRVTAQTEASGAGGEVEIKAQQIKLEAGGGIVVGTLGGGNAGKVTLTATDTLLITGERSNGVPSLVTAQTDASGAGGDIEIDAHYIKLEDGGGISVKTYGKGQGGNLKLIADGLLITQGTINAGSQYNGGLAGSITITTNDNIRLQNQGRISTQTDGASGGNIYITTAGLLHLTDSEITTSVRAHQGRGGDIVLNPLFIVLDDSNIIAQAVEGDGGNMNIETNNIYVFPSDIFPQTDHQERLDEAINASSQLGIDGVITVNSPDINIGETLVILSSTLIDASDQLRKCIATALSERNHFYVKRLPKHLQALDDLKPSRLLLVQTEESEAHEADSTQSSPKLAWLTGCQRDQPQETSSEPLF